MRFRDRADAGRQLAWRLQQYRTEAPVVVGLPRGGVPVAAEVARALEAPLDVLVVRKLGCPWQPELALGALGEDGAMVLNQPLIAGIGLAPQQLAAVVAAERGELERRLARYRGNRPPVPVAGRTVIVVDDGLATGASARAAARVLRRRGAQRIVLAVPVAPPDTVKALGDVADEVVALETPRAFLAIGQCYDDFTQTSDQEVTRLLAATSALAPVPAATPDDDPARDCVIDLGPVQLAGELTTPSSPIGIVVFAHGSGSSRHSPRNRLVAHALNHSRLATLLLDLLTPAEEGDRGNVFDIELLAGRLVGATRWLQAQPEARGLPVGFFGASTGAAAALWATADLGDQIRAVVSRGGRPDLAAPRLGEVRAPTLLIVGGRDQQVLELNRQAQAQLRGLTILQVIPGAGHLFEEPGALDRVAALAAAWFRHHLSHTSPAGPGQTPQDPPEPSSRTLTVLQG
jgi:putative phosphoribosyl transferase